ncbi:MAG TPA: hypothetical protein PLP29_19350, partial [Candidatus Ozemobacteraceae bacterium]|nr:hypothetical protein [Candidatus Ozemobacteraceae bacterium]
MNDRRLLLLLLLLTAHLGISWAVAVRSSEQNRQERLGAAQRLLRRIASLSVEGEARIVEDPM